MTHSECMCRFYRPKRRVYIVWGVFNSTGKVLTCIRDDTSFSIVTKLHGAAYRFGRTTCDVQCTKLCGHRPRGGGGGGSTFHTEIITQNHDK
jgi:hypothetical protein